MEGRREGWRDGWREGGEPGGRERRRRYRGGMEAALPPAGLPGEVGRRRCPGRGLRSGAAASPEGLSPAGDPRTSGGGGGEGEEEEAVLLLLLPCRAGRVARRSGRPLPRSGPPPASRRPAAAHIGHQLVPPGPPSRAWISGVCSTHRELLASTPLASLPLWYPNTPALRAEPYSMLATTWSIPRSSPLGAMPPGAGVLPGQRAGECLFSPLIPEVLRPRGSACSRTPRSGQCFATPALSCSRFRGFSWQPLLLLPCYSPS